MQIYRQAYGNWIQHDVRGALDDFIDSCVLKQRQFAAAVVMEIKAFAASKHINEPFAKNGGG